MLDDLARNRFYGHVEIEYQNGRVILVKKTESFKAVSSYISNGSTPDNAFTSR